MTDFKTITHIYRPKQQI